MDDKKYLVEIVKKSDLPQKIKNDLLRKIATYGATAKVANEIANFLDLQADVLEVAAHLEDEEAGSLEQFAKNLRQN